MLHLIRFHEPHFTGKKMRLKVVTTSQQAQSRQESHLGKSGSRRSTTQFTAP